jgi:hypothetical protein
MHALAVFLAVVVTYVNVFNKVAVMYFDSGDTMTWKDFYRHFVPPMELKLAL